MHIVGTGRQALLLKLIDACTPKTLHSRTALLLEHIQYVIMQICHYHDYNIWSYSLRPPIQPEVVN